MMVLDQQKPWNPKRITQSFSLQLVFEGSDIQVIPTWLPWEFS